MDKRKGLRGVVQVLDRIEPRGNVKRVMSTPRVAAFEDLAEHTAEARVLPALDAAPIDVRPEDERARAWGPDAVPVEVRDRRARADFRVWVGRMQEREKVLLRLDEGRVRARSDLGLGVVYLVEHDLVWRCSYRTRCFDGSEFPLSI